MLQSLAKHQCQLEQHDRQALIGELQELQQADNSSLVLKKLLQQVA